MEAKKNIETSEFRSSAGIAGVLFGAQFWIKDRLELWAAGLVIVICGYIVSRALFKKYREQQAPGHKTSEFYAYVFGIVSLIIPVVMQKLDPATASLLGGAIQAAYNYARGVVKSKAPNQNVSVQQINL